jgi:PTS system nitrogen regulatory IIA component
LIVMKIVDLVRPEHIAVRLSASSKAKLVKALSARAAKAIGRDAAEIEEALNRREDLGSTGVGQGVAIPHARLKGLDGYFAELAVLDRPVEFDAIDGKPVDVLFLLLVPETGATDQLAALASISRCLRDRGTADKLRRAKSADEAYSLLERLSA